MVLLVHNVVREFYRMVFWLYHVVKPFYHAVKPLNHVVPLPNHMVLLPNHVVLWFFQAVIQPHRPVHPLSHIARRVGMVLGPGHRTIKTPRREAR